LDCVFDEKVWVSLCLFREGMKEKITERKRERDDYAKREREREKRINEAR